MVKEVDRVGPDGRHARVHRPRPAAARASRPSCSSSSQELAPSAIEIDGDKLIVRHCYVERRMTPLDLYLETATPEQVEHVVREYGDAIRELAIANIFAGDLLWRNFGLNRHGRVGLLRLRRARVPDGLRLPRDPAAAEPRGRAVRARSGTPSANTTSSRRSSRRSCSATRGSASRSSATTPSCSGRTFWQDCQRRVAAGEVVDFFPYPESMRFRNRFREAATWTGL